MIDVTKEDWHRSAIGGKWDELGKLQFDFLVSKGLSPESTLLDIGCGSLRGGVLFAGYLNKGNYYGIEKEEALIVAAKEKEIPFYNLESKNLNLYNIDNFNLNSIDLRIFFDYMLAQSVFTHILPEEIEVCLASVMPRLKENGVFFATIKTGNKADFGEEHRWRRNERSVTRYPFEMFQEIAEKLKIGVEYIGDWGHPRDQKMLSFYNKDK